MPAWVPFEAAYNRAVAQRTANANGTLHLYTDALTPTAATTQAEYEAAEATFDDYTAITVTAWFTPILGTGNSFLLGMPEQQFQQGGTTPSTPNMIRGAFYKSAGGVILYAQRFAADVPIQVPYAGVPVELVDVFATGFSG